MNWYLVTTKTGEQDKAEDNLGSQMFEVFNPKLNEEMVPLFPNYIFVKFDPLIQSASKINNSYGVGKLVTFGNVLVPMPNTAIETLKKKSSFALEPMPKLDLKHGENVEVLEGPFTGVNAIFDEPDGEKRSFIIIEMLGNQQRLAVSNRSIA